MATALPKEGMTVKAKSTSCIVVFFPFPLPLPFFPSFSLFILLQEKSAASYHHDTSLSFSLPTKMLKVSSERTALCRTYREVWRP